MLPLIDIAVAVLITCHATALAVLPPDHHVAAIRTPVALTWRLDQAPISDPRHIVRLTPYSPLSPQDTVTRKRPRAVVYSEAYGTRVRIHRVMSWAMLPLFAASYLSGDQLLEKGSDAPSWARQLHGPAAGGSAVLFSANAITGGWNLWEGRKDPNGRKRRFLHAALFTVASGGFAYAGTRLADEAEQSASARRAHRNVAVGSIGLSTASWLLMLIGN